MESYGLTVLRLMVGAMFAAHGAQKLFGALGGAGLSGTAAQFETLGLSPGFPLAVVVGGTEFGGGLLLMAGAFTRYVSAALTIASFFFLNWMMTPGQGHGVEYHLVIVAALLCLALSGPGALSVDHSRLRSAQAYAAGRARLRGKL